MYTSYPRRSFTGKSHFSTLTADLTGIPGPLNQQSELLFIRPSTTTSEAFVLKAGMMDEFVAKGDNENLIDRRAQIKSAWQRC
jgi:hypothetical protein